MSDSPKSELSREQVEGWLSIAEKCVPEPWVSVWPECKYYGTEIHTPETEATGYAVRLWHFTDKRSEPSARELERWRDALESGRATVEDITCDSHYETAGDYDNAEFIAASRTAVPALCRDWLALRDKLDAIADADYILNVDATWKAAQAREDALREENERLRERAERAEGEVHNFMHGCNLNLQACFDLRGQLAAERETHARMREQFIAELERWRDVEVANTLDGGLHIHRVLTRQIRHMAGWTGPKGDQS